MKTMKKIVKNNLGNFLVILLIFLIITGWIWQKPEAQAQAITIFYETFPNADFRWNGSSDTAQDEPGWVTIQGGDNDTNDIQVSNEDIARGTLPSSGGAHLTFEDCDTGAVIPNTVNDLACVSIDLAGYTSISIEYYWQSDDIDSGEWLQVSYSTDAFDCISGTWTEIGYFENPTDDTWHKETYNLPDADAVSTFRLRFASKSNSTGEHFYVDDLKLTGMSPPILPATWKAAEDIPIIDVNKNENIRLRIEIGNSGSEALDYDYLLEYAQKIGYFCDSDESFITVPVVADTEHFEITESIYFTNGDLTTPKLTLPNGYTFVAGRMVEDPSNSSNSITMLFENYTEIEFVFQANDNAIDGASYCFRLTNAGTPLDDYSVYPELQIVTP